MSKGSEKIRCRYCGSPDLIASQDITIEGWRHFECTFCQCVFTTQTNSNYTQE